MTIQIWEPLELMKYELVYSDSENEQNCIFFSINLKCPFLECDECFTFILTSADLITE